MWSFEYVSGEQGVFCIENQEAGFHLTLTMEDGMSCEIINQNPIAFFYSKRADATKQVKTVICVNIQNYTLNVSVRMSDGDYIKHDLSLTPDVAKSLFNMANMYQHQKIVPNFSFKKIAE
jgi:hypothetical protein